MKKKSRKPKSSSKTSSPSAASSVSSQDTLSLIETDKDIQSYIYQQIADFENFVTPETLVLVLAKDPKEKHEEIEEENFTPKNHRVAIILKEGDTSLESEAYDDDIYTAIRLAKTALLDRLIEIQQEMESPQDRLQAIQQASANEQIH